MVILIDNIVKKIFQNQRFNGETPYWPLKKGKKMSNTLSFNSTICFRKKHNILFLNDITNTNIQKEILKWGGINNFKQYGRPVKDAINLIQMKNEITSITADTISSYSKLFAFYNPSSYFIFDARVCYIINKLIMNNNLVGIQPIRFNIQRSRNLELRERFSQLNIQNTNSISIQSFYPIYCNLINEVFSIIIDKNPNFFLERAFIESKPEIVEMFLFHIAI